MKKNTCFPPLVLLVLIIASGSRDAIGQVTGVWSGTVSLKISGEDMMWKGEMELSTSFTDNKGYGTIKWEGEGKVIPGKGDCSGQGVAELHNVVIYPNDSTYEIYVIGPECSGGSSPNSNYQNDIHIADEKWNGDPNRLSGTKKIVRKLDVEQGTATITFTWDLVRTLDVELIVTPTDYDKWLPEPGKDETTVGIVMNIALNLQSKTKKPLTSKAKEFVLRLSNTSKEPGITINYPISPRARQLPDLRFMKQPGAEILEDSQYIKISCNRCETANVKVGSYDGGGWTTLTAIAILEDGTRVTGNLLRSGGETEIGIPKRDPGSRIASSWLSAYGVPEDIDDKEESIGNKYKGDGLTAYEEYRGVISFGQFQRLDPTKKELGFLVKRSEIGLFSEGISRFQNASDIAPIYFDRYEIPDNRRINQNAKSAHDFDQSVLRISKGNTGQQDIYPGIRTAVWGRAYPRVDIPARITHIVIDVDAIHNWSQVAIKKNIGYPPTIETDIIGSVTAHEIGHAVNLPHHGLKIPALPGFTVPKDTVPRIRIFSNGTEITARPYNIVGTIGSPGNYESGDVSCFLCYRNITQWVRKIDNNNDLLFYEVPGLLPGTKFCAEKKGTGINAGNNYYGNANIAAECLKEIKLRD